MIVFGCGCNAKEDRKRLKVDNINIRNLSLGHLFISSCFNPSNIYQLPGIIVGGGTQE